jgi:potassium-dependent mechanosensitive channel
MTGRAARLFLAFALMLAPAWGQTPTEPPPTAEAAPNTPPLSAPSDTPGDTRPARTITFVKTSSLDYSQWETVAVRAEELTAARDTDVERLDRLRAELVDWRGRLQTAQTANASRIDTVRQQITALGAAEAGEAPEIAQRRESLAAELTRLQAPGLAAEEAYRRADGLIAEIDRTLRARAADELLKLWPIPLNPTNWPAGIGALRDMAVTLWSETQAAARWPSSRVALADNLPLILLYLVAAIVLLWRGRGWIDGLVQRLQGRTGRRAERLWALVASLGQIIVPTLGVLALAQALELSGMLGRLGRDIVALLPTLGLTLFGAVWLGGRVFPHGEDPGPLTLPPERRTEGRFLATMFGVVLVIEALRYAAMTRLGSTEAAVAVLALPVLALGGLMLMRMGRLIRRHALSDAGEGATAFRSRTFGLIGRAAVIVGVVGAALACVGYISAAGALIYPAILSLALIGLLLVLHQLVGDLYAAILRTEEGAQTGLIPTLVSFALTLFSLPVFALVWGARQSDLTELWTRFSEGFQIGATRISPSDFLVFAIIFAAGYMATRLFQGSLKSTILPKTRLDQGAQNAIAAGVGYIGIILAALIAINSAGLDLSGLAIVAGALSVGIGFGLQNIVSNFVSGIILLIERPISEGDWVEVGTVQGIVKAISVRSTRIQTFDRSDVIVPNADFVSGRVTNWTRFNLAGRLTVPVTVIPGSDTRAVERILQEIAEAHPLAILTPPPIVALMGFGAEAINFELRIILRDVNFLIQVRTEINHQIAARFAAAGIDMSPQARDLRLRMAEETPA